MTQRVLSLIINAILFTSKMDFGILLNFISAIALGALIGVERQRGQSKGAFAGIRTFPLIAFLGALSAFLTIEFDASIMFPIIFIAIVSLVSSSYVLSAKKGYWGITAEISVFITFLLGYIVMFDNFRNYALLFSVIITIILSFKEALHGFVKQTKDVEWNDALKFALISLVILPLLPEEINIGIFPEGDLYVLNIFNLKEIWLLVVLVCAISFVGYFLVKYIGQSKGANIIGAMGGLVSSTAVTQSMSIHSVSKSKKGFVDYKPLSTAVLLATIVSFFRVGIISVIINSNLYRILVPVVILVVLGFVYFILQIHKKYDKHSELKLKSPFKLRPALILGGIYALLTFISKLSLALNLGKSGVMLASVITGFFDIDPVILTVSSLSLEGSIGINDAIISILLAVASNQITKSFIAVSSGSRKFGKYVARVLLTFDVIIFLCVFIFLYID